MHIQIESLGKRYQRHWVFRNINCLLERGSQTAILGHNGSGKSTLLRILAGMQTATEGSLSWVPDSGATRSREEIFRQVSLCAPGMELPEELNLTELLQFHFRFKKMLPGLDLNTLIEYTGLAAAAQKPLVDFSSGMKQRVKLAQAFFSDTPLLLLDEPCSNLDEAGVQQYRDWITRFAKGRTVVVASNDAREFEFCAQRLSLQNL